jgi:hypothetical protein
VVPALTRVAIVAGLECASRRPEQPDPRDARKARGYRNKERVKNTILFMYGLLDMQIGTPRPLGTAAAAHGGERTPLLSFFPRHTRAHPVGICSTDYRSIACF